MTDYQMFRGIGNSRSKSAFKSILLKMGFYVSLSPSIWWRGRDPR
jgi:hypothetical protein